MSAKEKCEDKKDECEECEETDGIQYSDNDINNFINDYFIIKGYSTVQSFSGTEGLLRLNTDKEICCIILDLMLPGISGEEIIKNVRDVSDVPIIAVSAKSGR